MIQRILLFLLVAPLGGCGDGGPSFIAFQSDFEPFASWPSVELGSTLIDGHPTGRRVGYVKERTAPGATAYPVGALVVKVVENGADPQLWDLFAMAKRGGGFNAGGARDWEFFTLRLTAEGHPVIVTRGDNPAELSFDGGVGHGYADPGSTGVTCNRCHGALGTERSDRMLSLGLAPGAQ